MFEHVAKEILEISLLSIAAIILVMIIKAVFGTKLKTKILGVLWMLVLVRLVLPVTLNSPVQLGNVLGFNQPIFERMETQYNEADLTDAGRNTATIDMKLAGKSDTQTTNAGVGVDDASNIPTHTKLIATTSQMPIHINPWHVVLAVWFAGAIGFLTVNIYIMFAFKKKMRSCKTLETPILQRLVDTNKAKLSLSQSISVKECQYISVPVVTGFKHPVILLPAGLSDAIDINKLDKIILHEMCHIKRNDFLKNYLWLFARALHWFNPLIWFAYKAYLNDVENACDEYVLKHLNTDEVYEYSEALVEIVKRSKKINCAPVLVSFCKDKSKLRKRVMNMLNPQKKSKSVSIIAVFMMVIIVIGCFTTACTSAETQDISTEPQSDPTDQPAELDENDPPEDSSTPVPEPESTLNVKFNGVYNHDGDLMLSYTGDDGMEEYSLFKSNLSLESAYYTHNQTIKTPIEISDDQAMEYVNDYVIKFWPDMTAEIEELVVENSAFDAEGVLINPDDQSKYNLRVIINGKGRLIHIIRIPQN